MVNAAKNQLRQSLSRSIALNGALPFLLYISLKGSLSETQALVAAVIVPAAVNLILFVASRTIDVLGCFLLTGIILSLVAAMLGGNPHLLLIRDAFTTGIMGFLMLTSLLFPRPLIYYFARRFQAGATAEDQARYDEKWSLASFRRTIYLMTAVWGSVLVLEAIVRVVMALRLTTTEFLTISPLVQYGTMGGTIFWTVWYVRTRKRLSSRDASKDS